MIVHCAGSICPNHWVSRGYFPFRCVGCTIGLVHDMATSFWAFCSVGCLGTVQGVSGSVTCGNSVNYSGFGVISRNSRYYPLTGSNRTPSHGRVVPRRILNKQGVGFPSRTAASHVDKNALASTGTRPCAPARKLCLEDL